MDWTTSSSLNRASRKKRAHFGKSISEPNLLGHFTPRFPDNLKHLLHEYVTVDELKFYRKRRPPNIDDEFHSKDSICLYDKNQPIIPFAELKTEYTKEFGKTYNVRSRSVPNKFDLNATTKELLDALRDNSFSDFTPLQRRRASTAKVSGEIEINGGDASLKRTHIVSDQTSGKTSVDSQRTSESKDAPALDNSQRTCTFQVHGELSYLPDFSSGEFKGNVTRGDTMNPMKLHGKFHGMPEYRDNFKSYNQFTKSAPIKAQDHLRVSPVTVNTAIVSPSGSTLSEYTDKYKQLDLKAAERRKLSKQISNVAMKNSLMIGHCDAHVFPEYFDTFKDPNVKKPTEKCQPHSPILSLSGSMDYSPEYRSKFTEYARQRPKLQRPVSHFDFFERPRKTSPVHHAIITPKFNRNVAIVEPSPNIHQPSVHPITIDKDPFYLCQPEVRKARHEVLIKKRPPSPNQTIAAAIRSIGRAGRGIKFDENEENKRYNEQSHIVSQPIKPPVQVLIDNFDEPTQKPTTLYQSSPVKYGRRVSMQPSNHAANSFAKRNQSKIIEGNCAYIKKKTSLTSTTSTDDEMAAPMMMMDGAGGSKLVTSQSFDQPSFVVLKDPIQQNNKWMKSSWYL